MTLQTRPLLPLVGVEIIGVDVRRVAADVFTALVDAFNAHSVLLFRGQRVDDAEQVAFSRRFGPLETTIRTVVSHFGADISAWDVVNEVIDPSQPDGFQHSAWFNITGTDYIERAFRVAREAAPNARLYINDFATTDEPKRTFLLNLVRDLLSRGVPIDGIGHQMHNNIEYPSAAAVITTLNQFTALGLDNQITELDVSICSGSFTEPFTDYEDIPVYREFRIHCLTPGHGEYS